jgi:hypothetical protein
MTKVCGIFPLFVCALVVSFGVSSLGDAHTGIVDGYGCHRGPGNAGYHCHQGQFVGQTFKSKEDFLRQLRGGKAQSLSPKTNPPRFEKKNEK